MNAADTLRAFVVRAVILALIGLAFGLYGIVGYLLVAQTADAVPDALWLAAGAQTAVLGTLLANSKGNGPTEVTTAPGDAVATVPADEEF